MPSNGSAHPANPSSSSSSLPAARCGTTRRDSSALANDQVLSIVRDVTDARRARELNRALAGRLIVSQEEERQRIARELHDDLSQKIAVLNIDVDRLSHQLQTSEHRSLAAQDLDTGQRIAEHLHDLSYELHPARLQTLGLLESLRVMCSEFSHQRDIHVTFAAADRRTADGHRSSGVVVRVPDHAGSASQRRAA